MRRHYLAISFLALAVASTAVAQAAAPAAAPAPAAPAVPGTPTTAPAALVTPPATDTVAPEIAGVVKAGTKVQVIKQGLTVGTEGPIAMNDGSGAVLFTNQQGNTVSIIDPKTDAITTFLDHITGINAITITRDGRFIGLQRLQDGGKAQIAVIYPKDKAKVLSDNINGMPLLAPNDLISDKKGGVYFTVPGAMPPAVYYITPDGKTTVATTEVDRPNGISLNRTETVLYVASGAEYNKAFDINPDGTLKNGRDFAKTSVMTTNATTGVKASGADGMTVDSEGRLYVANNAGVEVYSEQGQSLGVIPLSRKGQNLAFGGVDKKTLYVVGTQAAWKIDMVATGIKDRSK
jgi:gluconolactonase